MNKAKVRQSLIVLLLCALLGIAAGLIGCGGGGSPAPERGPDEKWKDYRSRFAGWCYDSGGFSSCVPEFDCTCVK